LRELRAGAAVTLAGVTLIPIERVRVSSERQPHAVWLHATKEALAVVICDPAGPRVLDVWGREWPVGRFVAEIPELGSLLAALRPP
jgi:hypothetical protein